MGGTCRCPMCGRNASMRNVGRVSYWRMGIKKDEDGILNMEMKKRQRRLRRKREKMEMMQMLWDENY